MNLIDTTQATDPTSLQPFTTKSLNFLQTATKEMVLGLSRSLVGELFFPNTYAVPACIFIAGCEVTGNDLGDGYILLSPTGQPEDVELFYYVGQSGVLAYATPQFELLETNDPVADPVEFSDAVSKNVHTIRQLTITNTGLGTGLANYVDSVNLNTFAGGDLTYGAGWSTYSGRTVKYRLDARNNLMIKGSATNTWTGIGPVAIGTLPAGGYRPLTEKWFVCEYWNLTAGAQGSCQIVISTAGVISYGQHVNHAVNDVIFVNLDNICIFTQW